MQLYVALFMGAWIEISSARQAAEEPTVALFMGAWIEIAINGTVDVDTRDVALFMGAWIEMAL